MYCFDGIGQDGVQCCCITQPFLVGQHVALLCLISIGGAGQLIVISTRMVLMC